MEFRVKEGNAGDEKGAGENVKYTTRSNQTDSDALIHCDVKIIRIISMKIKTPMILLIGKIERL